MDVPQTTPEIQALLRELLGYLNLSSGAPDPQFLRHLNELFRHIEPDGVERDDSWPSARRLLSEHLDALAGQTAAFRDTLQARAVLDLLDRFLPAYREFHRDLLFHQRRASIERPFFLGRAVESLLGQGPPWDEHERIVAAAISQLNDYVGHRPVAALESAQQMEPYEHEWTRPLPLFVRGAGVAVGRYERLIAQALDILRATPAPLLAEAHFDPELLDELAMDVRAYDFDHPANKRPNYYFGQWDPHHLDNRGRYRRFVVHQVTLDAMLDRMAQRNEVSPDELRFEAAAVLSGTILMAAGTSGSGPETFDSSTSLATLLPRIAAYRDAFYEQLLAGVGGDHGQRLRQDLATLRQPFAAARQHLNHSLARRRATQLEHVHLALLFARMGYPDAARRQAEVVPVTGTRLRCEIQCRFGTGLLDIRQGRLAEAAESLAVAEDLLHRGIECGALADPWNILGFQGHFSLFPAPENSVLDHRVEQLIEMLEQMFGLYARLWSESAAEEHAALEDSVAAALSKLAEWWDQFATTTVEGVESFSGAEAFASARDVAAALKAWNRAGSAAADIHFWREHVEHFNSPKAYSQVIEALLDKRDYVAAMALLVQWLSRAGELALKHGEYSFHALAERWLTEVCRDAPGSADGGGSAASPLGDRPGLVGKFFDYLEANAEEFGQVPRLDGTAENHSAHGGDNKDDDLEDSETDEDDDSNLYGAAYDDMVYVDSTDDGVEGEMLESGAAPTELELAHESRRLRERLGFLATVARLWKTAALRARSSALVAASVGDGPPRWLAQAQSQQGQLRELLSAVNRRRIPAPSANRDSLVEYDHRRAIKDGLLESVIATSVATADAARFLQIGDEALVKSEMPGEVPGDRLILAVVRAALAGDAGAVRRLWPEFLAHMRGQSLLYAPLNKGGDPHRIVEIRCRQQCLRELLGWLPRLGLLRETCQLIETARAMEAEHPVSGGGISEFDRLFEIGFKALVSRVVGLSRDWSAALPEAALAAGKADADLLECLQQLTEILLKHWYGHSRTLRLSVLEKLADEREWRELVEFIERYGKGLLTQKFLSLGNLRAILHQGVDAWLGHWEAEPPDDELALLADLGNRLPRKEAVRRLSFVFEAVAENYAEYRDYNHTTTQSDRGELLHAFLDFLRLRVQYDRVAWQLRPTLLVHEILVREGRSSVAEAWRRELAEKTAEVADTLERRLAELQKKYAMRLPTVADRIAERFTRPFALDRVRALIAPAIDEVRRQEPPAAFELLEQEVEELTQEPTGVGLEVPRWLEMLEEELQQAREPDAAYDPLPQFPRATLSPEEVQRELSESTSAADDLPPAETGESAN